MSKKSKGSKNNIQNRGKGAELRSFNGKKVTPVMYDGRALEHGKYVAAKYVEGGTLVRDMTGKPVPYGRIVDVVGSCLGEKEILS